MSLTIVTGFTSRLFDSSASLKRSNRGETFAEALSPSYIKVSVNYRGLLVVPAGELNVLARDLTWHRIG